MPKHHASSSRKHEVLKAEGALHPRPQDVTDPLFRESPFFDAHDLVQVKYEMLRRVRLEERSVSDAAADFGCSRPSFYTARAAFQRAGLPGLLPQKRGPRHAHKLTDDVLAALTTVRNEDGSLPRAAALAMILRDRFGITAHPRSIERSLAAYIERQEKNGGNRFSSHTGSGLLRRPVRSVAGTHDRHRGRDIAWRRPRRADAARARRLDRRGPALRNACSPAGPNRPPGTDLFHRSRRGRR